MKLQSIDTDNTDWPSLSYEEKKRMLFLRQKKTLDMFLKRGAISQAQHDKSLHDLIDKMKKEQCMGKKRTKRKNQKTAEDIYVEMSSDMDGTFAFIAGYTPGGVPYGVTWEQVGIDSELPFEEKVRLYRKQMDASAENLIVDDSDELPFD